MMEYYSIINHRSRSYKLVAASTYIKVRRIISAEMYKIKFFGKGDFRRKCKKPILLLNDEIFGKSLNFL